MRIVLLRHGKPDVPELGRMRVSELCHWIKAYNSAGLKRSQRPSEKAVEIAAGCNVVVCSDLPRSAESAEILGVEVVDFKASIFREMELPSANWPSPRLPPEIWAVFFRVLWFLGYSSKGESLREARMRALSGANRLEAIAEKHGSVILIGHGLLNRSIAKALLKNGWAGPLDPGKNYWEFGVYERRTGL
ncbi:MAG: histidine phosphatase family protein [gamma proteobacterium endosymbiont of Lamellibrachia anaximandri]|nr:histidine phosphatase family protein [gamma proteobacterium endosymbiont of Lamellibrachia anaximandri]